MAQLDKLLAVVYTLLNGKVDPHMLTKVAKKYGFDTKKNTIEFSDEKFTYSYCHSGNITNVKSVELANPKNLFEFTIDYAVKPSRYCLAENLPNGYRHIIVDIDSGKLIEYVDASEKWNMVGSMAVKNSLHKKEDPVSVYEPSVPFVVRDLYVDGTRGYFQRAQCFKHINKVISLILALNMGYSKLIIFWAQNILN